MKNNIIHKILLIVFLFLQNFSQASWNTQNSYCANNNLCEILQNVMQTDIINNADDNANILKNHGTISGILAGVGVTNNEKAIIKSLENFNTINGFFYAIDNQGVIETLQNSGKISAMLAVNNAPNATITKFENDGDIQGTIYGFQNQGNTLEFKNNKTIQGGIFSIQNQGNISDFINNGNIIFTSPNGAQLKNEQNGKIAISTWKITIDKSADNFNNLSLVDLSKGNKEHLDRIIIGATNLNGITFKEGAIKISVGQNFEVGKEYALSNILLQNNGGTSASVFDNLNLNTMHFSDGDPNDLIDLKFSDNKNLESKKVEQKLKPKTKLASTSKPASKPEIKPILESTLSSTSELKSESKLDIAQDSTLTQDQTPTLFAKVNKQKAISTTITKSQVSNQITNSNVRNGILNTAINSVQQIKVNRISQLMQQDSYTYDSKELYASIQSDIIENALDSYILEKDYYVYIVPYANYMKNTLDLGDAISRSYGILGGIQKDFKDFGMGGIFLGYTYTNSDAPLNQSYSDDTFNLGFNYYKDLMNLSPNAGLFTKSLLYYAFTNSSITRDNFSDQTKIHNLGFNASLGINYMLNHSTTLVPSVTFGIERYNFGAYSIGRESYDKSHINQPIIDLALGLNKAYNKKWNSILELGVRFLLNDDYKTNVTYNGVALGSIATKLPKTYGFIKAGVGYNINESVNVSLDYYGGYNDSIESHSGFAKIGWRF